MIVVAVSHLPRSRFLFFQAIERIESRRSSKGSTSVTWHEVRRCAILRWL